MVITLIVPDLIPRVLRLVSAFICVYIIRLFYRRISVRFALRHVHGPRPSSILWGEEWKLYHNEPGSLYADWHKEFGKVVKFSGAFGHQMLSITDPRAIAYIVGEGTYQFPKPSGVRAWFNALLGEGILWVEGKQAHERQRRALSPALNPQSIRKLTSIFYETSSKLAAQWSRQLDASQTGEVEIEVTNWAGRFALDTIGRTAFSDDFNCLSGQPNALAEALDGLTNNENTVSSFYIRALFWIFPSILNIGKKGKMIKETRKVLGDIASRLWRDAKVAGDSSGRTLMSLMLQADADTSAQRMTEEEIAAQLRSVIQAAYEPISATIAWTLYELSVNAALQSELREELSTAGDPTFDDLHKRYPLLDAVLKEVLRTHPPILENHHQAAETIGVPLSEPLKGSTDLQLIIPKGTILEIPLNVIQRDTSVWGSDAQLFRPHRWLERNEQGTRRCDLFAFSDGPRVCMGKTFAFAEMKALMVTLLRQFSFSCFHDIEPFQSFVIRPRIKGQGFSSLPLLVRKVAF